MKPDANDITIANNIRALIGKRERSKTRPKGVGEIATDAGIDPVTLWRYMNAKRRPSEEQLIKLAQGIGCQPWRFLVGVERPNEKFPNIEVPHLRKKPMYSRIETAMR